jgi:hypothetical protein
VAWLQTPSQQSVFGVYGFGLGSQMHARPLAVHAMDPASDASWPPVTPVSDAPVSAAAASASGLPASGPPSTVPPEELPLELPSIAESPPPDDPPLPLPLPSTVPSTAPLSSAGAPPPEEPAPQATMAPTPSHPTASKRTARFPTLIHCTPRLVGTHGTVRGSYFAIKGEY